MTRGVPSPYVLAWLCVACGPSAAPRPEPAPVDVATADVASEDVDTIDASDADPDSAPACFEVHVRPDATGIDVTITVRALGMQGFRVPPSFESPSASDGEGEIAITSEGGGLTFARPPTVPFELRYRALPDSDEAVIVSARAVYFDGRALLLPVAGDPCPLVVFLDGVEDERAASTLGAGATSALVAFPSDLRSVAWTVGDLERASFATRAGRDDVLASGSIGFDVRWAAAEIALMRSRVNAYFGDLDAERSVTVVHARDRAGAPLVALRSGTGLRVLVGEGQVWDWRARMAVAQALLRRWLGGVLRVIGPDGSDDVWVSHGIARWLAAELLVDMGTLSSAERAADLTLVEGAIALAEPGDLPVLRFARGVLYTGALAHRLEEAGTSLRELVLALLARAEDTGAPLPRTALEEALRERLGERLGDREIARMTEQALGESDIELTRGVFGPCLRRSRLVHRRFALGFEAPAASGPFEVREVVLLGPAFAAGVRDDMHAQSLSVHWGEPTAPARLALDDGVVFEWLPSDREARGYGWTRVPGVDEADCFRR